VIAVRNQKLKEEKEAATKGKKGANHVACMRVLSSRVLTGAVSQPPLPRASRA
jgi:hypothetical protein